jgi:DNA polymerase epsilon subunit 2
MDRTIFRAFKGRGLGLSADACRALASVLVREEDSEGSLALILDEIKDRIDKRQIASSVIDEDVISSVVAYLSSSEEDLAQESTQLFDAFCSPKVVFDERTKTYKVDPKPAYNLHGTVETRAHMFRERLLMTQQRLLRSGMFAMRGMGGAASSSSSAASSSSSSSASSSSGNGDKGGRGVHEISTIESLLGSEGTKLLFGLLTQPEEGAWFLEDLDATIRLDLSRARSTAPLLTEGSLVLVEGQLCGNAFRAQVTRGGTSPSPTNLPQLPPFFCLPSWWR